MLNLMRKESNFCHRVIAALVLIAFIASSAHAAPLAYMPEPTQIINTSPYYDLPTLRGIKLYANDPFKFDFIIDSGSQGPKANGQRLKQEASRLIKYFLSSLTIPEEDLWVNLSPYEKNRVVPKELGLTEMGKDLLGEDYILKQLLASLTYPESPLGKRFWKKVYQRALRLFGTTKIPINTFNKIWIVPDSAVVYEGKDRAIIGDTHLKVMLEEDYLALSRQSQELTAKGQNLEDIKDINNFTSQITKEVILPVIEEEVNRGKNFAHLRQIYNSLILAIWFKKQLKNSINNVRRPTSNIMSQVYVDKKKIKGISSDDPKIKEKIYNQYLEAFKKGVYNYIKTDSVSGQRPIRRRYHSGGADFRGSSAIVTFRPITELPKVNVSQASSSLSLKLIPLTIAAAAAFTFGMPAEIAAQSKGVGSVDQVRIQSGVQEAEQKSRYKFVEGRAWRFTKIGDSWRPVEVIEEGFHLKFNWSKNNTSNFFISKIEPNGEKQDVDFGAEWGKDDLEEVHAKIPLNREEVLKRKKLMSIVEKLTLNQDELLSLWKELDGAKLKLRKIPKERYATRAELEKDHSDGTLSEDSHTVSITYEFPDVEEKEHHRYIKQQDGSFEFLMIQSGEETIRIESGVEGEGKYWGVGWSDSKEEKDGTDYRNYRERYDLDSMELQFHKTTSKKVMTRKEDDRPTTLVNQPLFWNKNYSGTGEDSLTIYEGDVRTTVRKGGHEARDPSIFRIEKSFLAEGENYMVRVLCDKNGNVLSDSGVNHRVYGFTQKGKIVLLEENKIDASSIKKVRLTFDRFLKVPLLLKNKIRVGSSEDKRAFDRLHKIRSNLKQRSSSLRLEGKNKKQIISSSAITQAAEELMGNIKSEIEPLGLKGNDANFAIAMKLGQLLNLSSIEKKAFVELLASGNGKNLPAYLPKYNMQNGAPALLAQVLKLLQYRIGVENLMTERTYSSIARENADVLMEVKNKILEEYEIDRQELPPAFDGEVMEEESAHDSLAEIIMQNPKKVYLMTGPPGAGKTTFANKLKDHMTKKDRTLKVRIIHRDDFFRGAGKKEKYEQDAIYIVEGYGTADELTKIYNQAVENSPGKEYGSIGYFTPYQEAKKRVERRKNEKDSHGRRRSLGIDGEEAILRDYEALFDEWYFQDNFRKYKYMIRAKVEVPAIEAEKTKIPSLMIQEPVSKVKMTAMVPRSRREELMQVFNVSVEWVNSFSPHVIWARKIGAKSAGPCFAFVLVPIDSKNKKSTVKHFLFNNSLESGWKTDGGLDDVDAKLGKKFAEFLGAVKEKVDQGIEYELFLFGGGPMLDSAASKEEIEEEMKNVQDRIRKAFQAFDNINVKRHINCVSPEYKDVLEAVVSDMEKGEIRYRYKSRLEIKISTQNPTSDLASSQLVTSSGIGQRKGGIDTSASLSIDSNERKGGIDLGPDNLNIDIRKGVGSSAVMGDVSVPRYEVLWGVDLENFQGFTFQILEMKRIENLKEFIGSRDLALTN